MRRASLTLLLCALALWPSSASAHAELVSSDPSADSVLEGSPERVTLTFTEEPLPDPSSIEVTDSKGNDVTDGRRATAAGDALSVGLRSGLPSGLYTVRWNVATADGHVVSGSYSFAVKEARSTPSPPAPTHTGSPSGPVVVTGTSTGTAASDERPPLAVGIALIVAAVAAAFIATRRRSLLVWAVAGTLVIAGVWLSLLSAGSGDTQDSTIKLTVTPGRAGPNAFRAEILAEDGAEPESVTLRSDRIGGDRDASEVTLTKAGDAWTGQGELLSEPGTWRVTALIGSGGEVMEIPITLVTRSEALEPSVPGVPFTTASFASGVAVQVEVDARTGLVEVHATTPNGEGLKMREATIVASAPGIAPMALDAELGDAGASATLAGGIGPYTIDVVVWAADGRAFQATLLDVQFPDA